MVGLMGGSLLAIAAATVALVYGWATASAALIWTSIGFSVLAGILMALGYYRTRFLVGEIESGATGEDEPH